ncbi:hypothetical protein RR48_01439 [Papilio machaon]|uniref:Trissin n=1 Tax=Papilio machaon TaxID=76193 RepID=A0A0N0PDR1_PAPMA|nr:hypothetical protein RR48_01439 [Papilio machaon]
MLVSGLSCNSCGVECASSCGTRRFRTCCFNYLRKKRSDAIEIPSHIPDVEGYNAYTPEDLDWWNSILDNGRSKFDFDEA